MLKIATYRVSGSVNARGKNIRDNLRSSYRSLKETRVEPVSMQGTRQRSQSKVWRRGSVRALGFSPWCEAARLAHQPRRSV